ncbi:unnamed protein product [Blepharisma stoltei]|uniref:non-specific serine/threonine protein kinase n=1 Tax=Blepharisma stoltei TaxID=1481888 RepID=A0AAU9KCG0_9CILI|nr:unnamed protein product [Blepharisma stoltei]
MGGCFSDNKKDKPHHNSLPRKEENKKAIGDQIGIKINNDNIHKHYEILELLGTGHFGSVKRALRKGTKDSQEYAIKCIDKNKMGEQVHLLQRELSLLMMVNHPNIVKLYEVYEDDKYIYMVMEHCAGGELFEQLTERQRYNEAEASKIIYCIMSAVSHLHSLQIFHRDLKPENIMLSSKDPDAEIKIIDFGLAKKFVSDETGQNTVVGSAYYVAPEVLNNRYGPGCDEWSIGVIMYMLLLGKAPFDGDSDASIYKQIARCNYSQEGEDWDRLSDEAKDLLKRLLEPKANLRITSKEALGHPWFELRTNPSTKKVHRKVMQRLRQRGKANQLIRETMHVLIRYLKNKEIDELNEIFRQLDTEHTGRITAKDLQAGLSQVGVNLSDEDVEDLIKGLDQTENGTLNYSDFLAATLDKKVLHNKDALWLAFKSFDIDDEGAITKDKLKIAMERAGWKLTDEDIAKMFSEIGLSINEPINFEAFCMIFDKPNEIEDASVLMAANPRVVPENRA